MTSHSGGPRPWAACRLLARDREGPIQMDYQDYLDQTIFRAPDPDIFEICPAP